MPTTSSGETVYADPDELQQYVQTSPESLGLSTTADVNSDGVSDWQNFLESLQTKAKGRIDDYCRRDFEDHPNDTVVLDGGGKGVLYLPDPIRDVSEVRIDGDHVDADDYHAKLSGALIYTAGASSPSRGHYGNEDGPYTRSRTRRDGRWPDGYGNVAVDLTHGYERPPEAVREAEMKLVDHTLVGMSQKREGMVVQADSYEMAVNIPVAWNSEVAGMLKPHRSVEVGN
ncbi:hypothetical protein [Halococcus sp. AFM35]|uniref:hypothetical protein n=1 Tax=Halococcus sp. AFM35 TaxID=3421653 RepID=UPI003EC0E6D1